MLNWILDNLVLVISIFVISIFFIGLAAAVLFDRRERRSGGPMWLPPSDGVGSEPAREPELEPVEFAAFAPRSVRTNCSFILDIWAYQSVQYSRISEIAKERGANNLGRKTGVPISRGAILAIRVEVSQLIIKDPIDTLVWTGEPANTSYIGRRNVEGIRVHVCCLSIAHGDRDQDVYDPRPRVDLQPLSRVDPSCDSEVRIIRR